MVGSSLLCLLALLGAAEGSDGPLAGRPPASPGAASTATVGVAQASLACSVASCSLAAWARLLPMAVERAVLSLCFGSVMIVAVSCLMVRAVQGVERCCRKAHSQEEEKEEKGD